MDLIESDDLRKEATERVKKRRDLSAHLVVYVVVNSMFVGMWAITGAGYFWPAWILLGWAVGLILNVWDVYFRRPITEHDIEAEMRKLR
ncbi:MAG TPA: 2TM domain-containing protein [Acidimicrobiia bacterium]|nr:2TM domain-containing protein [Acidimicrobiia bacterium]